MPNNPQDYTHNKFISLKFFIHPKSHKYQNIISAVILITSIKPKRLTLGRLLRSKNLIPCKNFL